MNISGDTFNPIKAHVLTKRFGKLTTVYNLNFQIAQGEFFGILCPNGTGKTTHMQMLSSPLLPPNLGTAAILGIDAAVNTIALKAMRPYSSAHIYLNWQRNYAPG